MAIRLHIAIRPIVISAILHTKSRLANEPNNTIPPTNNLYVYTTHFRLGVSSVPFQELRMMLIGISNIRILAKLFVWSHRATRLIIVK